MNIKKKISEERLNVLISKNLKKQYKSYCIKKEYSFSKRIRQLIKADISGIINLKYEK